MKVILLVVLTASTLPLEVTFPLSPHLRDNQMSVASSLSPALIANKAYSGLFSHLTDKKNFILSLKNTVLNTWT